MCNKNQKLQNMLCQIPNHCYDMKTWRSKGDPREERQATNSLDWRRVMQVEVPEKASEMEICIGGLLGRALGDNTREEVKEAELGKGS